MENNGIDKKQFSQILDLVGEYAQNHSLAKELEKLIGDGDGPVPLWYEILAGYVIEIMGMIVEKPITDREKIIEKYKTQFDIYYEEITKKSDDDINIHAEKIMQMQEFPEFVVLLLKLIVQYINYFNIPKLLKEVTKTEGELYEKAGQLATSYLTYIFELSEKSQDNKLFVNIVLHRHALKALMFDLNNTHENNK